MTAGTGSVSRRNSEDNSHQLNSSSGMYQVFNSNPTLYIFSIYKIIMLGFISNLTILWANYFL